MNVHYSITYAESQKQVEYPPDDDQKNKLLCPRKALHHEKEYIPGISFGARKSGSRGHWGLTEPQATWGMPFPSLEDVRD